MHHGEAKAKAKAEAEAVRAARAAVLDAVYAAHPERFVRRPPTPPKSPKPAWINRPEDGSPAAGR